MCTAIVNFAVETATHKPSIKVLFKLLKKFAPSRDALRALP